MSSPYWLTSVMLGTASLLLFLGYFAHCFIAEGVVYIIYDSDAMRIDKYGGYYGQAVQMGAFAIMTIFAPAFVDYFTPKASLKFTGACFLAFFSGFLYFNQYFYYITQAICGVGYAVFNVAEGAFIAEQSTAETIDRFTTIETAISHGGQLLSGIVILAMHDIYGSVPLDSIAMTYLGFAISVIIGLLLINSLPSHADANSLAETVNLEQSHAPLNLTQSIFRCLGYKNMLLLIPLSIYQGLFTAFFLSIYPSSFNFVRHSDFDDRKRELIDININTMWIYCSCIGVGVIFGGAIMTVGATYNRLFTTKFSMTFHSILVIPAIVIIYISTPEWAFTQPSERGETGIQGTVYVITVAICAGICDCFITTYRSVLCQKMLPKHRLESFAITRITQALSACVALVLTPKLAVMQWCIILTALLVTALLVNCFILRHFHNEAKKNEEAARKHPDEEELAYREAEEELAYREAEEELAYREAEEELAYREAEEERNALTEKQMRMN